MEGAEVSAVLGDVHSIKEEKCCQPFQHSRELRNAKKQGYMFDFIVEKQQLGVDP